MCRSTLIIVASFFFSACGSAQTPQTESGREQDASLDDASYEESELPDCGKDGELIEGAIQLLSKTDAVTPESLSSAVRSAGSDLLNLQAMEFSAKDNRKLASWLRAQGAKAHAPLVCGMAKAGNRTLWIAAERAASIEVNHNILQIKVAEPYVEPEVFIEDPTGRVHRYLLGEKELRDGFRLDASLAYPLKVQVLAKGPQGPKPLAQRQIGKGKSSSYQLIPTGKLSDTLSALRAQYSSLPLRNNQLLRRVASKHAQAVCKSGEVVHELDEGGDPEARVALKNIQARSIGETVARAEDTRSAFAAMLASPSHRYTLLLSEYTDAGMAEARDALGRSCLVIVLASWPRTVAR